MHLVRAQGGTVHTPRGSNQVGQVAIHDVLRRHASVSPRLAGFVRLAGSVVDGDHRRRPRRGTRRAHHGGTARALERAEGVDAGATGATRIRSTPVLGVRHNHVALHSGCASSGVGDLVRECVGAEGVHVHGARHHDGRVEDAVNGIRRTRSRVAERLAGFLHEVGGPNQHNGRSCATQRRDKHADTHTPHKVSPTHRWSSAANYYKQYVRSRAAARNDVVKTGNGTRVAQR